MGEKTLKRLLLKANIHEESKNTLFFAASLQKCIKLMILLIFFYSFHGRSFHVKQHKSKLIITETILLNKC
jgi:hypothetical protein